MSSKIFLDFTVFPHFNAALGTEVGDGTTHCIRYSMDAYKHMLAQYVDSHRTYNPLSLSFDLAATTIGLTTTIPLGSTAPLLLGWNLFGGYTSGGVFGGEPQYEGCPLKEIGSDPPVDPPIMVHEDAIFDRGIFVNISVQLQLYHPRCEQDSWANATEVWLPFSMSAPDGYWEDSFQCETFGTGNSLGGGMILSNFLGIHDATWGTLHIYDSRIAVGDGTTFAYLKDPGTPDKYLITALVT